MLFNENVTIFQYNKNDEIEKRIILDNCYIDKNLTSVQNKGNELKETIKVLTLDAKAKEIKINDILVAEKVNKNYMSEKEIRKTYKNVYMVTSLKDNSQGSVKHFEIGGK